MIEVRTAPHDLDIVLDGKLVRVAAGDELPFTLAWIDDQPAKLQRFTIRLVRRRHPRG